ncbi:MAG: EndoU domain-containing protein [Wolbachia endosymbiont of Tyrophagus putrescentiae]|nr:EndoU domain-containing protein [Wolbachia endosymbiont of Tyrophagus putrescentiae]
MSKTATFIIASLVLLGLGFIFYYKEHYSSKKNSTYFKSYNFEPFFGNDSSDMPPLPELTNFDRGALRVCGEWGEQPDEESFRILLNCPEYHNTVEKIYDKLDHQVITPNASLELFKDELTRIWFSNSGIEKETTGFGHIFCGSVDRLGLGGMHFVGRYVEAQENKWAGAIWKNKSLCNKLDIKPPVYTFGMQYLAQDGKVGVKCPNGYAYNLHADDILIAATKAFKGLGKDGMCLYKMENDDYQSVFVRKNDAILTFYPDLTPKCSDKSTNCSCVR